MTKSCIMQSTFRGEELTATFGQTFVEDDYGVPNSPTFWSPEGDISIESCEIVGVDVNFYELGKEVKKLKALPLDQRPEKLLKFLSDLEDAVISFADEGEWA